MLRSGSLSDNLATDKEQELLLELKADLAEELKDAPSFPELVGDSRLLRTLRGFDHDVHDAAEAFREHLAVRRSWGLDAIREKLVSRCGDRLWQLRCDDLPFGEELSAYVPEVILFARGRSGDPVSLGLWGKQRVSEFIKEVDDWRDKFMQYMLNLMEAKALLLDRASAEQNRLVHFVNILDLENWSAVGNADRAWTEFATGTSGPVLQTYHDFNSYIFAIRTTRWARMAYSMIEPVLPKKVRDKVFLLGDDFHASTELKQLLHEGKLNQLRSRQFTSTPQLQEGHVVINRRDTYQLQIEVPDGATLTWAFSIEGDECLKACFDSWCKSSELNFSLVRCDNSGKEAVPEPLRGWESRKIGIGNASGRLDPTDEHGSRLLALRWDNSHAWLTSKSLHYRVELELPSAPEPPDWMSSARAYVLMVAANLAALGVAFALDRLTGAF
eukprot:TRINITY_DN106177_c0_g1_i1.p1 TRINITY_DN106177_c0_g1~~TRINITY_DN106177_c0_g1_i1.p1  ORF type:complete len:443 (-),score=97.95 TRINITY_DN106177_c0_g1_i1:33-1361(-)